MNKTIFRVSVICMFFSLLCVSCNPDELIVAEETTIEEIVPEVTYDENEGKIEFRSNDFLTNEEDNGFSYYCEEQDSNGIPTGLWFHYISTMEVGQLQGNVGLNGWSFEQEGDFLITLTVKDNNYDDLVGGVLGLYFVNIDDDTNLASSNVEVEILSRTENAISGTFTGEFRTIGDNINIGVISGQFSVPILDCF